MRYGITLGLLVVLFGPAARGNGLLIPEDRSVPPLAMVSHRVVRSAGPQVAPAE